MRGNSWGRSAQLAIIRCTQWGARRFSNYPIAKSPTYKIPQLPDYKILLWFDGVGQVGFEGDFDAGSWLEGYYVAAGIGERVFDADFAKQIVRRGDGDLRLFGQAGNSRLYNFVHDGGHGLPRAVALPDEFGMILKTALLFAADEVAEFAELAGKLVVVFFLLDLGAEHVHTFTFFGSHRCPQQ